MRAWLTAVATVVLLAAPLIAQHEHRASPYAEAQSTEVPSLTAGEIEQLRAGEGMGLARAAELSHFPGPKHVLEMRRALSLTERQAGRISEIRASMSKRAIAKGEEIIAAERHLYEAFQSGSVTEEIVERITGHLGQLRGELQAIHLTAHLATREALTSEQVERYDELRGYASRAAPSP